MSTKITHGSGLRRNLPVVYIIRTWKHFKIQSVNFEICGNTEAVMTAAEYFLVDSCHY